MAGPSETMSAPYGGMADEPTGDPGKMSLAGTSLSPDSFAAGGACAPADSPEPRPRDCADPDLARAPARRETEDSLELTYKSHWWQLPACDPSAAALAGRRPPRCLQHGTADKWYLSNWGGPGSELDYWAWVAMRQASDRNTPISNSRKTHTGSVKRAAPQQGGAPTSHLNLLSHRSRQGTKDLGGLHKLQGVKFDGKPLRQCKNWEWDPLYIDEAQFTDAIGLRSWLPCCTLDLQRDCFKRIQRSIWYHCCMKLFYNSARLSGSLEDGYEQWSRGRYCIKELDGRKRNRWRLPGWDDEMQPTLSAGFSEHGAAHLYSDMTTRWLQRNADLQHVEIDHVRCRCIWWSVLGFIACIAVVTLAAHPEEDESFQSSVSQAITAGLGALSAGVLFLAVVWENEFLLQSSLVFGIWQLSVYTTYFMWVVTHAATVTDVCDPSVYDVGGTTRDLCLPAIVRYSIRLGLSATGFVLATMQGIDTFAMWDSLNDAEESKHLAVLFRYIECWGQQTHKKHKYVFRRLDYERGRCEYSEVGQKLQDGYQKGVEKATGVAPEWDDGELQRALFRDLEEKVTRLEQHTDDIVFNGHNWSGLPARMAEWAEITRRRRIVEAGIAGKRAATGIYRRAHAYRDELKRFSFVPPYSKHHQGARAHRRPQHPVTEQRFAKGDPIEVRYSYDDKDSYDGWYGGTVVAADPQRCLYTVRFDDWTMAEGVRGEFMRPRLRRQRHPRSS